MLEIWDYVGQELLLRLGYSTAYQIDRRRRSGIHAYAGHPRPPGFPDPYEPLRRLAMARPSVSGPPNKPLTSFSIKDILSPNNSKKGLKRSYPFVREEGDNVIGTRPKSVESDSDGVSNKKHPLCRSGCSGCHFGAGSRRGIGAVGCEDRPRIVRPWNLSPTSSTSPHSRNCDSSDLDLETEVEIDVEGDDADEEGPGVKKGSIDFTSKDISPLDALMEMSHKAFKGLDTIGDSNKKDGNVDASKTQIPKKKRKTRTAFSNQQIYELEKRFLYQKYLTPADRDEIAQKLGLTCAQVITWFQNRRAKFKRDVEEMKNDVVATKKTTSSDVESAQHSSTDDVSQTKINSDDETMTSIGSEEKISNDNSLSSSEDQNIEREDHERSRDDHDTSRDSDHDSDQDDNETDDDQMTSKQNLITCGKNK